MFKALVGSVGFYEQDVVLWVSGFWTEGFNWQFPRISGTLFWDPYNEDPTWGPLFSETPKWFSRVPCLFSVCFGLGVWGFLGPS